MDTTVDEFFRESLSGETKEKVEQNKLIGRQNDLFRTTWGADFTIAGQIVQTAGVAALGAAWQCKIMRAVMNFDKFEEGNDPYLQRDFGVFELSVGGEMKSFYWKIDLYDTAFVGAAETPEQPNNTRRVMTILFPSEY